MPEERYARIDARLDAIAKYLKRTPALARADEAKIDNLLAAAQQDGENIRALLRIAESRARKN